MDLIDEQDRIGVIFKLLDDRFQPLFEIAAIAGARQKRAQIERIDGGMGQHLGRFAFDDLFGQTFGDGGFAHARITHQKRVVLAAAAQYLNAAFHLGGTPDQRVDIALERFGVQIDAIFGQRRILGIAAFGARLRPGAGFFFGVGGAGDRAAFAIGRVLGHAMGDEIDRVIARHVLFLQEIGCIAFPFGKDRDQHIGACDLGAARRLHMDRGALDHPLERGGGNGLGTFDIGFQCGQVIIDKGHQRFAQRLDIDRTRKHDLAGLGLVQQRQKQMLQRCQFMAARIRVGQRRMDGLLKCG